MLTRVPYHISAVVLLLIFYTVTVILYVAERGRNSKCENKPLACSRSRRENRSRVGVELQNIQTGFLSRQNEILRQTRNQVYILLFKNIGELSTFSNT